MDPWLIAALDSGMVVAILKAAFGLGLVIFVHELGHFLVAKACGVKCEKFYVGFDAPIKLGPISLPSALIKKQWGETEYGVGIIPLGGYVKMLGQDDNPANAAREAERIKQAKEPASSSAEEASDSSQAVDTGQGPEDPVELDPRSYPAKSVPQRMAIISAGVIMNLIFAVIFAAIAYRIGVSYTPCTLRTAVAGDPAWVAGLRPGDKIVQMGKDGRLDEHLRFTKDLRLKVFSVGAGNNLDLLVRRENGAEEWIRVQPNSPEKTQTSFPTIGVLPISSNRVHESISEVKFGLPTNADLQFGGGETIVAMEVAETHVDVRSSLDIDAALARYPSQEITFLVETSEGGTSPATRPVVVRPTLGRELGLVMTMGPLTAVAADSPAALAGLRPGDLLLTVNGQKIANPMLLEQQLLEFIGTSVSLEVQRDGSLHTMTLVPREPEIFLPAYRPDAPASSEALGIAYDVGLRVREVREGSPAAGRLLPDDQLTGIEFLLPDAVKQSDPELRAPAVKPGEFSWPWVHSKLQTLPAGTQVKLFYLRGRDEGSVVLHPTDTADWFFPERGILLAEEQEIRQSSAWAEAVSLGIRETKEGIQQVILVLKRIGDSYKNLGGPGSIAAVATMEAKEGIPRLLVFLTLLSANLAVINFLPIPVLDGGHMMFLIYEGVSGKPVNERLAFGLTLLGFGFIICLMLFVIGLDVNRFVFG